MISTRTVASWVGLVAVAATALTGCAVPSAPAESPSAPSVPAGSAQDTQKLHFGQTSTGPLELTVTPPREFTTSQFASPPSSQAWGVDVQISNRGPDTMQPAMLQAGATADGRAAHEVLDTQRGYQGLVTAPAVAPGESVSIPLAFSGQGGDRMVTLYQILSEETAVFTE